VFTKGEFAKGCNSSFVALIPKVLDPKVASDYRPISLIGSLYKVITKILATRILLVMSDLISDVQTTFLPNRQILDGPFIVNELLSRCKAKNHQAIFLMWILPRLTIQFGGIFWMMFLILLASVPNGDRGFVGVYVLERRLS
nr:RNA-directed DNA polymerase, eukaryota [Tanacetum cinerariifolium]